MVHSRLTVLVTSENKVDRQARRDSRRGSYGHIWETHSIWNPVPSWRALSSSIHPSPFRVSVSISCEPEVLSSGRLREEEVLLFGSSGVMGNGSRGQH